MLVRQDRQPPWMTCVADPGTRPDSELDMHDQQLRGLPGPLRALLCSGLRQHRRALSHVSALLVAVLLPGHAMISVCPGAGLGRSYAGRFRADGVRMARWAARERGSESGPCAGVSSCQLMDTVTLM